MLWWTERNEVTSKRCLSVRRFLMPGRTESWCMACCMNLTLDKREMCVKWLNQCDGGWQWQHLPVTAWMIIKLFQPEEKKLPKNKSWFCSCCIHVDCPDSTQLSSDRFVVMVGYKNKYRITKFERRQLFQPMIYAMLVVQIQNDKGPHIELLTVTV